MGPDVEDVMDFPKLDGAASAVERNVRWGFAGPDLTPVARIYRQGRYRRASVLPGPGEGLVKQSDAAQWRQIAELRWQMIEDLVRERDELIEMLKQLTPNAQLRPPGAGLSRQVEP